MSRFYVPILLAATIVAGSFSLDYSVAENRQITQSELRANTLALDLHLSLGLQKAKDATLAMSAVLQQTPLTETQFHELSKSIVREIGTVRAVLLIGPDGILKADSYNFPATEHNLSKREYFTQAVDAPDSKPIVSSPVNGKDSGTSFVPVARAVRRHGVLEGVTVAVVSPRKLINLDVTERCTDCMSMLVNSAGEVIAQEPAELETDALKQLVSKLRSRPSAGFDRIHVGNRYVSIAWIQNALAPVTSVYLKFDSD